MLPAQGVPKNGELSLRIRREVAEATGTKGEDAKERLYAAKGKGKVGGSRLAQNRCLPPTLLLLLSSCICCCCCVQVFRDADWEVHCCCCRVTLLLLLLLVVPAGVP
jgi:hypothetical protein